MWLSENEKSVIVKKPISRGLVFARHKTQVRENKELIHMPVERNASVAKTVSKSREIVKKECILAIQSYIKG